MRRALRTCVGFLIFLGPILGQTPRPADPRLEEALKEIATLKRSSAEQDRRIAGLERSVRSLENALVNLRTPPVISSRTAEGWAAVKIGMSRAQVVDILGEPQINDSVIDRQTLTYKDGAGVIGTVVIVDDRVSEINGRRFRFFSGSPQ